MLDTEPLTPILNTWTPPGGDWENVPCPACHGLGFRIGAPGRQCQRCKGKKRVIRRVDGARTCPDCGGTQEEYPGGPSCQTCDYTGHLPTYEHQPIPDRVWKLGVDDVEG